MLLGTMSATTPTNPANKLDETQINMLQKEGSTTEEKYLLKEPPKIADSEAQLYTPQHSLRSRTIKVFFAWWFLYQ